MIELRHDANGNIVSFKDANSVGQNFKFDALNRNYEIKDTEGAVTNIVYDANDNIVAQSDYKGNYEFNVYDSRNRKINFWDRLVTENYSLDNLPPSSLSSRLVYDGNNNVTSVQDSSGKITVYDFDSRNLNVMTTYPGHLAGSIEGEEDYDIKKTSFDALNRKDLITDQKGETIEHEYDMASRLVKRTYRYADGSVESIDEFTYDDANRPLTAKKGRYDNVISMTYDSIGRKKTETITVNDESFTTECSHDEDNRVTSCKYPNGDLITKGWTERLQLQSLSFNAANVVSFSYDDGQREEKRTFGNNLESLKSYNLDNTISAIVTTSKGKLSFSYDYDVNKNIESESYSDISLSDYSWDAQFDRADRLKEWNRLGNVSGIINTQEWDLDLIGNWASVTTDGVLENRSHNNSHELVSIENQPLDYDTKGNLSLMPGNNLEWDIDNHLIRSSNNHYGSIDYSYDAFGRRLSKGNTFFITHGDRVVEEYTYANNQFDLKRSYMYGNFVDDIVAKVENNVGTPTIHYYHQDRQFNVRGLTDNNQNIVELYAYSPYGKQITMNASNQIISNTNFNNKYGFNGRYFDIETNLLYYRARYFSDELGRFISRDPLEYVDGFGLYGAYFAQKFGVDPSGRNGLNGGGWQQFGGNPAPSGGSTSLAGFGTILLAVAAGYTLSHIFDWFVVANQKAQVTQHNDTGPSSCPDGYEREEKEQTITQEYNVI